MTALGQTEKNSVRAYVFRFALELGHCSTQSACLKCANSGLTHDERSGVASSAASFTPILVQDRAAGPSRNSAVARALRPSGFYTWQSLSLSMLRGMPVRPEGRIDREWAQSLLASRTPAVRRPAPDG